MKILITGANGFIGSAVGELLRKENYETILHSRQQNDKQSKAIVPNQLVFADLISEAQVKDLPDFDVLVHCAALMQGSWGQLWCNNVLATEYLLRKAKQCNARHVVLMSTGGVYGYTNGIEATELSPLNPIGWYGHSKVLAEQIVHAHCAMEEIRSTIFRIYFPYGSGQSRGVFSLLQKARCLGDAISLNVDGRPNMNFCNVADICNAVLAAINNENLGGIYNLCSTERHSFADLLRLFEDDNYNFKQVLQTGNRTGDLIASNAKLIQDFGWTPQDDLTSFINLIKKKAIYD